ncbi:MAG: hypothetical protein Q8O87_04260 [bacterium]|nr:hypothetical protein [bacterium]
MKRISINKSDEPASIVEKIIDATDEEVVLAIPRFAKFTESLSNFHLVKREAEVLNKKIIVESVDDKAIELAGISGLDSINPFFAKYSRQISDIVPKSNSSRPQRSSKSADASLVATKELFPKKSNPKSKISLPKILLPKFGKDINKFVWWIGGGILIVVIIVGAAKFLPKAEITILAKKIEWEYKDSVTIDKNLALADISGAVIKLPGQLFIETKNLSAAFPATGKKEVTKKASGSLLIYNAYSSDPQPLVVNTRFETPDGKIYRITKGVTVAGAKIVDGKIIPSTTEVVVVADKPGAGYNVGPVAKFSIPGFKGSPKFNAFYGQSTESMSGGFIGELAYPTDEDIKKAKASLSQQLEDSLKLSLAAQIPSEFKIIDGATKFQLVKEEVNPDVDSANNFTVLMEGEVKALVFKEESLKESLFAKGIKNINRDFVNKDYVLEYSGVARPNTAMSQMSLSISFEGTFWPNIDIDKLKQEVSGKSEADLRILVFALPDVESVKVSLWPFWVNNVPEKLSKISVAIE